MIAPIQGCGEELFFSLGCVNINEDSVVVVVGWKHSFEYYINAIEPKWWITCKCWSCCKWLFILVQCLSYLCFIYGNLRLLFVWVPYVQKNHPFILADLEKHQATFTCESLFFLPWCLFLSPFLFLHHFIVFFIYFFDILDSWSVFLSAF